ncbi:hypothetical protein SKAU_G00395420 [Synaphobranchus kaupii]|uniref:Rho-GAP domain-containing protein n=1 Tax=Synaphobranchus kaupii TaxID=118154 RepID=A0A9Q1ECB3_SYNKA|nr:hypothetical protein SKAU_G00395420 [Synaphobranchus kaupii]
MGAGALTICHSRAAAQIKEDMRRMAQLPLMRTRAGEPGRKVFGVSLPELAEAGLLRDGIPLPVSSMVEFLREHALQQEGLFRVNGNVRAVEGLKQRFESGGEVDLMQEGDVCTVASLLKQFLRDLPGGVITSTVQPGLLQLYQECSGDQSKAVKKILQQLPDLHYNLLKYLCLFLTQVESQHLDNRMNALNLATVFGPNVFHVSPGFDGIKEQNLCNKVMVKLIQNYNAIFESDADPEDPTENFLEVITVKAALSTQTDNVDSVAESATEILTSTPKKKKAAQSAKPDCLEESIPEILTLTPRKKKATRCTQSENLDPVVEPGAEVLTSTPRKKKVRKVRGEEVLQAVPQPVQSEGLPHLRAPVPRPRNPQDMDTPNDEVTAVRVTESLSCLHEGDRPISPFYMSSPFSSTHWRTESAHFLERTIRLAVEQHLFDTQAGSGSGSGQSPGASAELSPIVAATTKQRHPQQKDQDEIQKCKDMSSINKENIPSSAGSGVSPEVDRRASGPSHGQDRQNSEGTSPRLPGPPHCEVTSP